MPNTTNGYAVFFFPNALEALGEAIKPYLQDSPMGPLVFCHEVDTGGAFIEMTLVGVADGGARSVHELMVPSGMVRMIVSNQSDSSFGFGPRTAVAPVSLPPPLVTAAPAAEAPAALPADAADAPTSEPTP